ncbi:FAR-17a/AIG1-like protein [Ganoderma leucocontextum]|nr:FAR-17a/AIG1-like protein [Ganoderma leucocontextum]
MAANLRFLPFLLHTTAVAVMTYGYLHLPDVVGNMRMQNMKGGHFQFLTIQGLCIACITMVLSLGCDLIPSLISIQLSIVISAIYWTLLSTMPHMILMGPPSERVPTSSRAVPELERLPMHTDLALHAAPAISLILDFYVLEPKYPKSVSRYGSLVVAAILGTWYACWVEYCASYNGMFPYPFLTYNPFNIRMAIYIGASLFAAVAFMVMNALHR